MWRFFSILIHSDHPISLVFGCYPPDLDFPHFRLFLVTHTHKVLFPIYSRGLNQPFYIIFNCSCSEFHPLIYLPAVTPFFSPSLEPVTLSSR